MPLLELLPELLLEPEPLLLDELPLELEPAPLDELLLEPEPLLLDEPLLELDELLPPEPSVKLDCCLGELWFVLLPLQAASAKHKASNGNVSGCFGRAASGGTRGDQRCWFGAGRASIASETGRLGAVGLTLTRWWEGSMTKSMSSIGIAPSKT